MLNLKQLILRISGVHENKQLIPCHNIFREVVSKLRDWLVYMQGKV